MIYDFAVYIIGEEWVGGFPYFIGFIISIFIIYKMVMRIIKIGQ